MTQRLTPTPDAIQQAVTRAVEAATEQSGGQRLLPFTAAEIRFIQEVVTRTLTDLLAQEQPR